MQGGQTTPIDLVVEEHFHRAAPGGMGGTKAAGNYSPVSHLSAALCVIPHHRLLMSLNQEATVAGHTASQCQLMLESCLFLHLQLAEQQHCSVQWCDIKLS